MNTLAPGSVAPKPWADAALAPFIRIDAVSKNFGTVKAVNEVSLKIYSGELFCLLGGSGCGKTTLLRMLAGFETPSAGSISIEGQDLSALRPHERPTNMMFQSYALFPHMNVAANVGYGLRRDGVARKIIANRVEEMLALVQLEGLEKRKPNQLSGGQRQRVALARALIKRPKLLLLDEPLGALDKKLREQTQFELVNIQEQLGVTFVVVTHDQEEAMTLASRIGVMDEGQIVQVGEPHEIYERPSTRFVADFIGSINIFEGGNSGDEFGSGPHLLPMPAFGEKDPKYYAIRPEKITISRTPNDAVLSGSVEEIAYLGNQSVYVVKLIDGQRVRVNRTNRQRDEAAITWEDQVYLSWSAEAAIMLPR